MILSAFLDENPDVTGELNLTDGIIDIVAEGIDFAVRQGTLSDSSQRVRPIGISRRLACAAPAYLGAMACRSIPMSWPGMIAS